MIKHAQRNYPQITFKQMEIQNFKLNKKFDAIIAIDSVLTFLTKKNDFEKAIKNIVNHMKKCSILFFNTGFTEKLIPKGFTDHFVNKVEKNGMVFKKEFFMKRKRNLVITNIKISENDKIILEEEHKHRIISEKIIMKLLSELSCKVKISGNFKQNGFHPLEVLAKKE